MHLGVIAYVPPPRIGNPAAFLQNLSDFPTKNPLILYSDHSWPGALGIPNPEKFFFHRKQTHTVNNLIFLLGLRIAIQRGLTHFIYLESDCRVRADHWDKTIFDEFFAAPGLLIGGTLAGNDMAQAFADTKAKFDKLTAANTRKNFPVCSYVSGKHLSPFLFSMGALTVFDVQNLKEIFGRCELSTTALDIEAWDKEIGRRMWKRYGLGVFDKMGLLKSVYSTYGNIATTEEQRQEMLKRNDVVAVHQIKTPWVPNFSFWEKRFPVNKKLDQLTVVITSFKRPEFLIQAFQSCVRAGVGNTVITASGEDPTMAVVFELIRTHYPKTIITSIFGDKGCNECWLRGAMAVQTPWVHILHDDDMLLPAFADIGDVLSKSDRFNLLHWNGAKHGMPGISGTYDTFLDLKEGIHPTKSLTHFLTRPNCFTLSPVSGLFRLRHVIDTLTECQEHFGPRFNLKPGLMVGNDLMLWLRATEKYDSFYYFNRPLISYGHHAGSASFDDVSHHRGKLLPIYQRTRKYFYSHPLP